MGSGRDLQNARADRDFRMNPPETEIGQGGKGWADMGQNDNSFFSGSEGGNGSNEESWTAGVTNPNGQNGNFMDQSNPMNSMNNIPGVNTQQLGNQTNPQLNGYDKPLSEKVGEAAFTGGVFALKGLFKSIKIFIEEFGEAIEDNKLVDMFNMGALMFTVGEAEIIIGVGLLLIRRLVNASLDYIYALIIGGLITFLIGFRMSSSRYPEVKGTDTNEEYPSESNEVTDNEPTSAWDEEDDLNLNEDFPEYEDDDPDSIGDAWDLDEDFSSGDDIVVEESEDPEELIEKLDSNNMPVNMYTRQYLFETFYKVLPKISPNYSSMVSIPEGSDDFIEYEDILREAASQVGIAYEELPELLELRENLLIVQLKVSRTAKCKGKENDIAKEIVSIYKKDDYGENIEGRGSSYAAVETVGRFFIINIFTGACPLVSLGDIYSKNKDYILDTNHKMPYVWGINEYGREFLCDIKDTNSFIISGSPRGGKSWKVQSLLLQICMFSSPDEVNIYVHDTKGAQSDYINMSKLLPHFKGFYSTKESILASLERLTGREAERRSKLIKSYDNGVTINIKDFKEKNPTVKLPYIYIVIDEMQSLTKSFDKDEAKKFQEYTSHIVSKLPGLGFRVIFIPHRIVNEIISKLIYPLVNSKACIMLPIDEIKNSLDINKDFKYSLPNKGDMALKSTDVNNNTTCYCHSEVVSSDNSYNWGIYKYVGEVWKKLLPGCELDSVGYVKKAVDTSFTNLNEDDDSKSITLDDIESLDDAMLDLWD